MGKNPSLLTFKVFFSRVKIVGVAGREQRDYIVAKLRESCHQDIQKAWHLDDMQRFWQILEMPEEMIMS